MARGRLMAAPWERGNLPRQVQKELAQPGSVVPDFSVSSCQGEQGQCPGGQEGCWCGQRFWGTAFGSSLSSAVVALWQGAACPVCAQGGCWVGKLRQVALGAAPLASVEDREGSSQHVWVPLKVRAECTSGAGAHGWAPPEVSPWAVSPSQTAPHMVGCFVGVLGTAREARVTQMAPLGFQGVFVPP